MTGADRERAVLQGRSRALRLELTRIGELLARVNTELDLIKALLGFQESMAEARKALSNFVDRGSGAVLNRTWPLEASERSPEDLVATASERNTTDPELEQLEERPE